jgi:uncharacterized RDD family membrane protein YckC
MTWYYVINGQVAGPISDQELLSKFRLGAISRTTLVWRSGMAEWQPAAQVTEAVQIPLAPQQPVRPFARSIDTGIPPQLAGTPPVLPHFFCTFCGQIIPADQLVRISGRAVCAPCKPLYVQQVSEGLNAPVKAPVLGQPLPMNWPTEPDPDLADPLARLLAYILDWVFILGLLGVAWFFLLFFVVSVVTFRMGQSSPVSGMAPRFMLLISVPLALGWVFFYWTFFIGRRGASPGMKIMKLELVRGNRSDVSYSRAFARAVALDVINLFTMGLTNITAFFDREKRTVVDMICDTRVVRN